MTAPKGSQNPAERVEVWEDIHQGYESQSAPHGGTGETQNAFLHTCPHRRKRAKDASNDRSVDSRISKERKNEVADKSGERSFDGKVKVFWIGEGIGSEEAAFILGRVPASIHQAIPGPEM